MSNKVFQGNVVSNKMTKTLVVSIVRKFRELRTGKIVSQSKKYKIHSEDGSVKVGDVVEFTECRPLSREKRFRLVKIVQRASELLETSDEVSGK